MTEKLKSLFELVDTKSEILAWLVFAAAIAFELRGFDDFATVALVFLSVSLHGYVHRAKAGPIEFESK